MCDELTARDNAQGDGATRRQFGIGMGAATLAMMLPSPANALTVAGRAVSIRTADGTADGWFVAPTVIEGLGPQCATNREEIFGPVVTLQPFDTDDEALQLANAVDYGLAASIWTRDLLTGKARQLTLLNALSQAPVTDGRLVVFSSNHSGTHQLWQVGLDGTITMRPGQPEDFELVGLGTQPKGAGTVVQLTVPV